MKNGKNIKAIALDFWGVFAVLNPPMNQYLREQGISIDGYSKKIHDFIILHDLGRIGEKQFLQRCSQIVGVEIPYDQCKYVYREGTLNEQLINILKKLRKWYTLALLSNNNREYVQEYIYKPGLDKLFDVMIISCNVGYRKPASEIYRILIRKLGLKPNEILFLDDEPSKLTAAEAQGLQTIVYQGTQTNQMLELLLQSPHKTSSIRSHNLIQ